jgi:secreted trypsin-like serine protease
MLKIIVVLLLLLGCGAEKSSDLDIVGGKPAWRGWYGRFEVANSWRCGSTLIDRRWSITAKHCLPGVHSDKIKVRLGAYNSDRNNGGKSFDLIKVTKVVEHPKYDMALLKLERPAKFKPIGYANMKFPEGYKLHSFGFGNIGWGVPGHRMLGVTLKHRILKNSVRHIINTDGSHYKGVCHGDSGGPLIDPKTQKLVGVTSWTGSRCASERGVDGFVRPDLKWIKRVIKKKGKDLA